MKFFTHLFKQTLYRKSAEMNSSDCNVLKIWSLNDNKLLSRKSIITAVESYILSNRCRMFCYTSDMTSKCLMFETVKKSIKIPETTGITCELKKTIQSSKMSCRPAVNTYLYVLCIHALFCLCAFVFTITDHAVQSFDLSVFMLVCLKVFLAI